MSADTDDPPTSSKIPKFGEIFSLFQSIVDQVWFNNIVNRPPGNNEEINKKFCEQFIESLAAYHAHDRNGTLPLQYALSGYQYALSTVSSSSHYFSSSDECLTKLCHSIYECFVPMILGKSWLQLSAITVAVATSVLYNFHCHHSAWTKDDFLLLTNLTQRPWQCGLIADILSGIGNFNKAEVDRYLLVEGEFVLKHRLRILVQEGAHQQALNLATACVHHPTLCQDPIYFETLCSLCIGLDQMEELQTQVNTHPSLEHLFKVASDMMTYAPDDAVLLSTLTLKRTWSAVPADSRSILASSEMWADVISSRWPPGSARFADELERVSKMTTDSLLLYYFVAGVHQKVGSAAMTGLAAVCLKALKVPDVPLAEDVFQAAGIDQGNAAICYLLKDLLEGDTRLQCLCLWAAFFIAPSSESFGMLKERYAHPEVPQPTSLDCWQQYNLIQCIKYFLPVDIALNKNWDYAAAICVKYLRKCKLVCTRWQLPDGGVRTLRLYDKSWNPCFLDFVKTLGVKRIRGICHTALKRCKRGTQLLSCSHEAFRLPELDGRSTVAGKLHADADELPLSELVGEGSKTVGNPQERTATPILESGGYVTATATMPEDNAPDKDVVMVDDDNSEGYMNNNDKGTIENGLTHRAVTSCLSRENRMEIDTSSETDSASEKETEPGHLKQRNVFESLRTDMNCARQAEASSSCAEREIGRKFRAKSTLDIPVTNMASTHTDYVHSADLSSVAGSREMDWLYFAQIQRENMLEHEVETCDGKMTTPSVSNDEAPNSTSPMETSEQVVNCLNSGQDTQSWEQEELSNRDQEVDLTSILQQEEGEELEEIHALNSTGNFSQEWTEGNGQVGQPHMLLDNQEYDEEPLNLVQERTGDDFVVNKEDKLNHTFTHESNGYMTKENVMWNSPPQLQGALAAAAESSGTDQDTLTGDRTNYLEEEEGQEEVQFVDEDNELGDLNDAAATADLDPEAGAVELVDVHGDGTVRQQDLDDRVDATRELLKQVGGDPLGTTSPLQLVDDSSDDEVVLQSEEEEIDITSDFPGVSNGYESVTPVNQESIEHEEEPSHQLDSVVSSTLEEEPVNGLEFENHLVGDTQSHVDSENCMLQLQSAEFLQEEPLNLVQGESVVAVTSSKQIEKHVPQTLTEEFAPDHLTLENGSEADTSECTMKQSVSIVDVSSNMMRMAYAGGEQAQVEEWGRFVMDKNGESEVEGGADVEKVEPEEQASFQDNSINGEANNQTCTVHTDLPKEVFDGEPASSTTLDDHVALDEQRIEDAVFVDEVTGVIIEWIDENPDTNTHSQREKQESLEGYKIEVIPKEEKEEKEESDFCPALELFVEEAEDEMFPESERGEMTSHLNTYHDREASNGSNDINRELNVEECDGGDGDGVVDVIESDETPSQYDTPQEMEHLMNFDSCPSDMAEANGTNDNTEESDDEVVILSELDESRGETPLIMHYVSDQSDFGNMINSQSDSATENQNSIKMLPVEQGDVNLSPRDTVTMHNDQPFQYRGKESDDEDLFLKRDSLFGVTYSSSRALRNRPYASTRNSDYVYPVVIKKEAKSKLPIPPQSSEQLNATRASTRAAVKHLPQHPPPDGTFLRSSRSAQSERAKRKTLKSQRTPLKRSPTTCLSYDKPKKFSPYCAKSLKNPNSPPHTGSSASRTVVRGSAEHPCRTQVEPYARNKGAAQAKVSLKSLTSRTSTGASVRQNSQQARGAGANGVTTRQQRRGKKNANQR